MKKVRTMQRYKCDFCNKRGVKYKIEKHEKICYKNPDRYCPECDNTGEVIIDVMEGYGNIKGDCPYCKNFDPDDPQYNPDKRTEVNFNDL